MEALIQEPPRTDHLCPNRPPAADLRAAVWSVLGRLHNGSKRIERRGRRRYPYPYLVRLTPVDGDGVTPQDETVVVVGKHLSEQGIGFYHRNPLPYRRMIVSLETAGGDRLRLLIDVTWCRFTEQGWYESGGRFLQTVPS